MLVIIKSSPGTPEAGRGFSLARDMAADICLIQDGVGFSRRDMLDGFCGSVYVLEEDCRLRGLDDRDMERDIRGLDYDGLVELMLSGDKVLGAF